MACELMIPTLAIRNLIREDKLHQVYSLMQTGQDDTGMQTMNQCLAGLVKSGTISRQDAIDYSNLPEELNKVLLNMDKGRP